MSRKRVRWSIMCIPGNADDGSDSAWFVVRGRNARIAAFIGDGYAGRLAAGAEARKRNGESE